MFHLQILLTRKETEITPNGPSSSSPYLLLSYNNVNLKLVNIVNTVNQEFLFISFALVAKVVTSLTK